MLVSKNLEKCNWSQYIKACEARCQAWWWGFQSYSIKYESHTTKCKDTKSQNFDELISLAEF